MGNSRLTYLDDALFDVVVVGAGAVGCAAARELAGRGFKTLLLDRGDIGAGTSSRSSRMLYSGVGYLAPSFPLWMIPFRPISLLQRFLYARNIMHCKAELVRDMPGRLTQHRFHYPFRKEDRYPSWLVAFAFRMMEALCSRGVPLSFRRISPRQAANESELAGALGDSLSSIGVFNEYMYSWPERICVDTALDAEQRGATVQTYAKVTGIKHHDGQWCVTIEDQAPDTKGAVTVHAAAVVNAAGPWVDRIAGGNGSGKRRVLGRKGVNVMVRLPPSWRGQGLEALSSKGEHFYVFPWNEFHFIGPTESSFTDDPDTVSVTDSEIDYILNEANAQFPELNLTHSDVLYAWCGVRPMSTQDGKSVSLPVRAIHDQNLPGLVTITGSYIMMHRHAGRLAAKFVEKNLGKRKRAPKGMLPSKTGNDIHDIIKNEHVMRLVDIVRRRLPIGLNSSLGYDQIEELSHIAASVLGWSEDRRQQEITYFQQDTSRVYRHIEREKCDRQS